MAALTAADVTATLLDRRIFGRQRQNLVKLVFGDSAKTYASGGVPLPSASALGLTTPVLSVNVVGDVSTPGTVWRWDYGTNSLRALRFGHIPPVIVSEVVTLTSHVGTLKYPPAYIFAAVGTISATVQPLRIIPTGITPATKQMAVNFTTGGVACLSTDSVTACAVSYIPQQAHGPFSAANMVVDEQITLSTSKVNTAFRAATMQYCYQITATAARLPFGQAEASGVVLLVMNDSGNTSFDCHADNNGKVCKVTYLKHAGFANNVGTAWIDAATITLTTEAVEFGKAAGDRVGGIMIPATGGQLVLFRDTSVYEISYVGDSTVTAASTITKFDVVKQTILTAETNDSETITNTPFLFLSPFYSPVQQWSELTVNDAPAPTTLYAHVIG